MRLVAATALLLAAAMVAVFGASPADAAVESFNAAQFVAMKAGQPIPGLPFDANPGLQPFTMWVVRFALAGQTSKANATAEASAFLAASERVPTSVARFADLVLASSEEMAIADVFGIAQPNFIRAFNSKVARPDVPRGNSVSGRAIALGDPVKPSDITSADAIVRYAYESVPPNFNDAVTDSVYPAAQHVKDEKALTSLAASLTYTIGQVAAPSPAVALRANEITHALVLVFNLRSRDAFTLDAIATALATGAALRGRGGVRVLFGDQRGFPDWAPEDDGSAVIVPVKGTSVGFDKIKATQRVVVKQAGEVAAKIAAFADAIQTIPAFLEANQQQVNAARVGAPKLTSPPNDGKTPFPVRRIDTGAQFQKQVTELKMGAAVVFFVRESDRFYGKVAKVARKVAEDAARDNSATIGGRKTNFNFEVFIIDAEVHKEAARELQVPLTPSVGFFLELKDKSDVKGLRYFKAKDIDNAKPILKFMREELFNGREMMGIDPLKVKFNPQAKGTIHTDINLMSEYIDVDPRRFDSAASDKHGPEYDRLTVTTVRRITGEADEDTAAAKKKKNVPANETPAQKKKREAREAKQAAREEAKKAKIKAEMEAKLEAKKRKMAEKQAQEEALAQKRKDEAEKKLEEAREKRKREEADGTAAKRRAAKKAKKARLERLAKLKKAKLAAKIPKDRATMVALWAKDSQEAAAQYTQVDEAGKVSVLDRLM
jgi:hypothetical protein